MGKIKSSLQGTLVMRQLGDMGKRGSFDFVPTLLKNEIPPLLLIFKTTVEQLLNP